ncbi:MAG: hypothetical protein WCT36_03660, partial [Candidatus Gracilibacteria bacterium]
MLNKPGSFLTVVKTVAALLTVSACISIDDMRAKVFEALDNVYAEGVTGCEDTRDRIAKSLIGDGFTENEDGRLTLLMPGNHIHVDMSDPIPS